MLSIVCVSARNFCKDSQGLRVSPSLFDWKHNKPAFIRHVCQDDFTFIVFIDICSNWNVTSDLRSYKSRESTTRIVATLSDNWHRRCATFTNGGRTVWSTEWKYGWFGCGFIEEHPAMFLTPVEFCFEGSLRLNRCQHCEHLCFIVCSWCKTYLCFEHFWNLHFCTDYAI